MVGNDIVDIKETKRSTNWERRGFLQKIFTKQEQEMIANAPDPFTTVWHLWSLKESAYKAFSQAGGDRFFNPARIECSLDASAASSKTALNTGAVKIDTFTFKTITSINDHYIFSTATINNADIKTIIFQLPVANSMQQSKFMQQQVINDFAINNSLNRESLTLQKTITGVPTLYFKNKPLNTSFSITHHGKYGAYSILKMKPK